MKSFGFVFALLVVVVSSADAFCPGVTVLKRDIAYRKSFLVPMHLNPASSEDAPKPEAPATPTSPCNSPYNENEREIDSRIRRIQRSERSIELRCMQLERKVVGLENVVNELCSALLYCDDVALMERQARRVGDIYLDSDFSTIRRPRMLRQELMSIMNKHNMSTMPLMYTWQNAFATDRYRISQDEVE